MSIWKSLTKERRLPFDKGKEFSVPPFWIGVLVVGYLYYASGFSLWVLLVGSLILGLIGIKPRKKKK